MSFNPPLDLALIEKELPGWRVLQFIKKGGFKAAYRGEFNGKVEALKLFHLPDFGTDAEEVAAKEAFVKRFIRETRLLQECETPHLVKLASLDPTTIQLGGVEFIAYSEEFLQGESIHDLIVAGILPNEVEVANMMLGVARAIEELWGKHSCVHRDIKPDNLKFRSDRSGAIVVLDLGISFDAEGTRLTETGAFPGTPPFRAPEMLTPAYWDNLTERTDMYCLGVSAFIFATGKHPLEDGSGSLTGRILNEPPKKVLEYRPGFDPKLASIIDRMNRKAPPLRGTLGKLIADLEAFIS